jgi:hypothetical protein
MSRAFEAEIAMVAARRAELRAAAAAKRSVDPHSENLARAERLVEQQDKLLRELLARSAREQLKEQPK